MALLLTGDCFDHLQRELMWELSRCPDYECAPRGQRVKECLATTLVLSNPRARLTSSPARAAKYTFAAGEFLWYLRGAEDLASLAHYNPRMREFSDDGVTLNSAYGKRLREQSSRSGFGRPMRVSSQWLDVVDEFKIDPDSRRAVMTVYSPWDMYLARSGGTKDVPCTLALQFLIREGRLHLHVTMRSNDAVWGLANDLFSFTLLQETMLLDLREAGLDLELGTYAHTAGSMHLYERHFAMADAVVGESQDAGPMPAIERREDLDALLEDEATLRSGGSLDGEPRRGGALWLLDRLVERALAEKRGAP